MNPKLSQAAMNAWQDPIKRANIIRGQRKARLGTHRYFTLEKYGRYQQKEKKQEEPQYVEPEICVEGHILAAEKIIDALDVPEEFLKLSKIIKEPNLHKIIRIWVTTQCKKDVEFEFFSKLKAHNIAPNRPIDVVVSNNNGWNAAYEVELFDKDMRGMLINLLWKRRFYENLYVVVPKHVFIVKTYAKRIKNLPSFLKDYDVSLVCSPFHYDSANFSSKFFEKIEFSK